MEITRTEIGGQHRIPAAASRAWEALSDRDTVERSLPRGVSLGWAATGALSRIEGAGFAASVKTLASEAPSHVAFRLSPGPAGRRVALAGRAEATLAEDGAFTLLTWRFRPEGETPDAGALTATIDAFLARIGQHAAVPVTVAAEGLSGVTTSVVEAVPHAADTPFGPMLVRIAAWPRELAIGGALFALVLLIVVGIF